MAESIDNEVRSIGASLELFQNTIVVVEMYRVGEHHKRAKVSPKRRPSDVKINRITDVLILDHWANGTLVRRKGHF